MWDRQLPMRVQKCSLAFRTNFGRGIVNYPSEVEDYTGERKPCLISAVLVRQSCIVAFVFGLLLDPISNVGTSITHSSSKDWNFERTSYLIVPVIRPYWFCRLRVSGDDQWKF